MKRDAVYVAITAAGIAVESSDQRIEQTEGPKHSGSIQAEMTGLAWLNELMVWLGRWFPRLTLIKCTHVGVIFGRAGRVRRREPGLVCWWPIVHDLQLVSVRPRTSSIAAQLHDGEALSVVVVWQVADALQVLTSVNTMVAYLDDRVQVALGAAHARDRGNAATCACMLARLREELNPLGVAVHSVDMVQRSHVFAIKKLDDYAHRDAAVLE